MGGLLAACAPIEDAGDCNAGRPCENRGEVCDVLTNTCEPAELSVDGTGPEPAPQSFNRVLPFFRGEVCMPTAVQPGDNVPVKIRMCVHPCVTATGYKFKKQYRCLGSSCESAVIAYSPATGEACPADVFGRFGQAECEYLDIAASVGPFNIDSGPVSGTASVEIPFLTNDDAQEVSNGASVDAIWGLIYKYPQDSARVFQVSMNASNPKAPADCAGAGCTCRDIGF